MCIRDSLWPHRTALFAPSARPVGRLAQVVAPWRSLGNGDQHIWLPEDRAASCKGSGDGLPRRWWRGQCRPPESLPQDVGGLFRPPTRFTKSGEGSAAYLPSANGALSRLALRGALRGARGRPERTSTRSQRKRSRARDRACSQRDRGDLAEPSVAHFPSETETRCVDTRPQRQVEAGPKSCLLYTSRCV